MMNDERGEMNVKADRVSFAPFVIHQSSFIIHHFPRKFRLWLKNSSGLS